MESFNFVHKVIPETLLILFSIFFVIFGYPCLLITLFPLWLYREFVKFVVGKDPKAGNILEGIGGVLAGNSPYTDPLIVPTPYFTLAGKLDVPQVVKTLQENVFKHGHFPELTQRIVQRYGYQFWYSVDNFRVEDHIRYFKPKSPFMPVTRMELRSLLANSIGKLPFNPNRSPWELLVIPNYVDDRDPEVKSAGILRLNHCLMDGYSITNFLQHLATKPSKHLGGMMQERAPTQNKNLVNTVYKLVLFLLTGPYHALEMFCFSNDKNDFITNASRTNVNETLWNSQCTKSVPKSRLKNICNLHGVTMTSLITMLFAQATYKSMKKAAGGKSVYKKMHGFITFPLSGHPPQSLSNHWSCVRIPIKISEQDPAETLKFVDTEIGKLKNSVKPLIFVMCLKLISILPQCCLYIPDSITPTTFVLTNFPGPVERTDVCGYPVKYIGLSGKTFKGMGFVLSCFSVSENFWFDGGAPTCNMPTQKDADYLAESVVETISALEKGNKFYEKEE